MLKKETFFIRKTKGTVTFDKYGDRSTPYGLYNNIQKDGFKQVAQWDPVQPFFVLVLNNLKVWQQDIPTTCWPDGTQDIPADKLPILSQSSWGSA